MNAEHRQKFGARFNGVLSAEVEGKLNQYRNILERYKVSSPPSGGFTVTFWGKVKWSDAWILNFFKTTIGETPVMILRDGVPREAWEEQHKIVRSTHTTVVKED